MIVKIAVNAAPYSIDKPYDYLVPEDLLDTALPGVRVRVPFGKGNRETEGIVLARNDAASPSPPRRRSVWLFGCVRDISVHSLRQ